MESLSCLSSTLLLLFALAFVFEFSQATFTHFDGATILPMGGEGSIRPDQCGAACAFRCSATSHKKPCLFYCNECCAACLCVPSGTYGNKEECPCYNNRKTKEGGPKCP